jgi:hypothetical protein
MCEQCPQPRGGWMAYRFAIRKCPRLASLGPATVEWLNQAIMTEVDEAIEIENEWWVAQSARTDPEPAAAATPPPNS